MLQCLYNVYCIRECVQYQSSVWGQTDTAFKTVWRVSLTIWDHYEIQSSPFAPLLTNKAEVSRVTWHAIARSFRATTKARLSVLKQASWLAAGDVRLAPLLAQPPGEQIVSEWTLVSGDSKLTKPGIYTDFLVSLHRRILLSSYLAWGSTSAAMARKDYAAEKGKVHVLTFIRTAWQQQVGLKY